MTDDQIRPDVVQAYFDAVTTMDPAKAAAFAELAAGVGISSAERRQAEDLILAAMLATSDHRDRRMEAWDVLISRQWSSPPSWEEMFDDLTPQRAARLRDLYDALPDGARAEFDKRYGRPED